MIIVIDLSMYICTLIIGALIVMMHSFFLPLVQNPSGNIGKYHNYDFGICVQ